MCTYLKKNQPGCKSEYKCNLVLKPAFQSNLLFEGGLTLAQGVDPQPFRDCWNSSSSGFTAPCCPLLQPHKDEEHCSGTMRSGLITCIWVLRWRRQGLVGDSQPNQGERLQKEQIYPVSESIALKLPKHSGSYKTITIFKEQTAVKEAVIPDKNRATKQKSKMG